MGPEENWQMKVTLPPHTLLPSYPELSFNPPVFHLAHLGFTPPSSPVSFVQILLFLCTGLRAFLLAQPSFIFLLLTTFSCSGAVSWRLTITASDSHSNLSPTLWCFSTSLVCASLLLYSGFKSTQNVLFYDLCCVFLCIATKAVRKHWNPSIISVFLLKLSDVEN